MINCIYCEEAEPLVIEGTNDKGIAIKEQFNGTTLIAYGYDVNGFSSNGLSVIINYCPMCGRNLMCI